MRALFREQGFQDAKVQSTTERVDGQDVQGFLVQVRDLQPAELAKVKRSLDTEFVNHDATYQVETVGPTFGEQIIRNAIWAILHSFAILVLLLPDDPVRVQAGGSRPCCSVVHDVWLAISIYSNLGREGHQRHRRGTAHHPRVLAVRRGDRGSTASARTCR